MKNYKVPLALIMVFLQMVSWYIFLQNVKNETIGIEAQLTQAQKYVDEKLYQKAIDEYDAVLSIKDTKETRLLQLNACYRLYEETNHKTVRKEIESRLDSFLIHYPKDAEPYEQIASYYYNSRQDAEKTITYIQRAYAQKIHTDMLDTLWQQVRYTYQLMNSSYATVTGWLSGYSTVENQGRYGVVDATGKQVIGLQYTYTGQLFNNLALAKTETTTVLIDGNGKAQIVLDQKYITAGIYNEGLLPVGTKDGYSYIDASGQEKHGGYAFAGTMKNQQAMVQQDDTWKIIDIGGNVITTTNFDNVVLDFAGCFNQFASFPAMKDQRYSLYDPETLQPVSSFSCNEIDSFYADGIAAFRDGRKWGFVDTAGNVIIEPQFDEARSFSSGFAAVCRNGKWGFIDTSSNLVVDYVFTDALYFNNSRTCWVQHTNSWDILYFLADE